MRLFKKCVALGIAAIMLVPGISYGQTLDSYGLPLIMEAQTKLASTTVKDKSHVIVGAIAEITLSDALDSVFPDLTLADSDTGELLVENTDYTVSWGSVTKTSTSVKYTITLKGNYTGSITGTVSINSKNTYDISYITIDFDGAQVSDGIAYYDYDYIITYDNTPTIKVAYNGKELSEGDDYISDIDIEETAKTVNINSTSVECAAVGTVTIEGASETYIGETTATFYVLGEDSLDDFEEAIQSVSDYSSLVAGGGNAGSSIVAAHSTVEISFCAYPESYASSIALPAKRIIYKGDAVGTLPNVSYNNLSFVGWSTGKYEITSTNYNNLVYSSTIANSNMTLYTVFTSKATCKVTFYVNGGTMTDSATRDVLRGSEIGTLPTATKDGYVLDGWCISGTTTKVTSSYKATGETLNLVASWKSNGQTSSQSVTLTFNAGSGTISGKSTNTVKITIKPYKTDGSRKTMKNISSSIPDVKKRTGYKFSGWGLSESTYVPTSNTTYTAVWRKIATPTMAIGKTKTSVTGQSSLSEAAKFSVSSTSTSFYVRVGYGSGNSSSCVGYGWSIHVNNNSSNGDKNIKGSFANYANSYKYWQTTKTKIANNIVSSGNASKDIKLRCRVYCYNVTPLGEGNQDEDRIVYHSTFEDLDHYITID